MPELRHCDPGDRGIAAPDRRALRGEDPLGNVASTKGHYGQGTRRVDAERGKIREDAQREADEAHRLKDAEKDRKLQDAIRANDELRRKLQQGSQQAQGEVLEATLEDFLKANFPFDTIEPVAKGIRGADVLQRVYSRSGNCGAILWESKNTKNWNECWIDKLKDDQRDAKADVAVVVSTALPKDVSGCGCREGIWLAEARLVLGLATALRNGIIELAATKRAVAGKNEAVEVLFAYLSSGSESRSLSGPLAICGRT